MRNYEETCSEEILVFVYYPASHYCLRARIHRLNCDRDHACSYSLLALFPQESK